MEGRRVVVTGIGTVNCLALNWTDTWQSLLSARSGIGWLTEINIEAFGNAVGGEVWDFNPREVIPPKQQHGTAMNVQYGIAAAIEAVNASGWVAGVDDPYRVGTIFSSGYGGIDLLLENERMVRENNVRRLRPTGLSNMLPDSASGQIAITFGARGSNKAVVSACATGTDTLGSAYEIIHRGDLDVALSGSTEYPQPFYHAFYPFVKILAKGLVEVDPKTVCKPFDLRRVGFVLSAGAACLVLEELDHALARGANIIAEIVGYASTNDATDMENTLESGEALAKAQEIALRKANVNFNEVGYINAHGTGTPLNDRAETNAIKTTFGKYAYSIPISSTKSMHGHMMGATGAMEAAVLAQALHDRVVPPTINYREMDTECDLDYVPNKAREIPNLEVGISNSLALGGHNAVLVMRRFSE